MPNVIGTRYLKHITPIEALPNQPNQLLSDYNAAGTCRLLGSILVRFRAVARAGVVYAKRRQLAIKGRESGRVEQ